MSCDYDPVSGAIGAQRVFADLSGEKGSPDGSAIDSRGYLWNAQWGGARVVRYAPDGQVDRIVAVPVSQPSCPAFGGANLDTLFVTTAHEGMDAAQRDQEPLSGGLFAVALDGVTGIPEVRFCE